MYQDTQTLSMALYFPSFRNSDWASTFPELVSTLSSILRLNLTHVEVYHRRSGVPLKSGRPYKVTHLNRLKLEQTLLDTEVDSIIYYEEPLGNPHKAVIEVNTQVVKLRYLLIYIESSAEHLQPEYAESVATRCRAAVATINQFADLKYGLVTWMPQASSPYIYFHEHISRPITANERRNLEAWFSQGQNYEHKIRGLYWANLFSSQHLAAIGGMFEFENAIGSQLPKDSVLVLEENKVFFTVPTKMRETVKSILESCGLII